MADLTNGLSQSYLASYNAQRQQTPGLDPNPYNVHSEAQIGDQIYSYNAAGDILGHRPAGSGASAPAPVSSGGGGGAPAPVFNEAGARNTQIAIDQLPALLQAALEAEGTTFNNTLSGYNAQEGQQRSTHDKSITTNQQNYDSNFMDSIRAGIKGIGGLLQILRGTGAAGGTAEDLARDTVGGVTSNDIRVGADTQKENASALDSALSQFLTELGIKRKSAEDTHVNNERAIRRDNLSQMQDLFGKMAGFYGDVGNTGEANNWTNRAGSLTPEIAANSRAQVSQYDQTPVAVKSPELAAFADPTQPSVVTGPNGQVGSGIFTIDSRKKREEAPALALAGV